MSLTVNSLDVIEFILGKIIPIFSDGVPVAERIGPKGWHLFTMFLFTLQKPYKKPGAEHTALISSCCLTLKARDGGNSIIIHDKHKGRIKGIQYLFLIKMSILNILSHF